MNRFEIASTPPLMNDILSLLSRADKWYLGGGNRLLYAPPFPRFLESPGLWDNAHYYNYELGPLFTWAILDNEGKELPLALCSKHWNPARLKRDFRLKVAGLRVEEESCVLPNDVASSVVTISNHSSKKRQLHIIAWTTQRNNPDGKAEWLKDATADEGVAAFTKCIQPQNRPLMEIACAFTMHPSPHSSALRVSEGGLLHPHWNLSPFFEGFAEHKLNESFQSEETLQAGVTFIALHRRITVPPNGKTEIRIAFSAAPAPQIAQINLDAIVKHHPIKLSTLNWDDHFGTVPRFVCSDEFLTRYYWYRWYGLKLNTLYGSEGNYEYPAVCEGIEYFRAPISYSAPCHMMENRWMHKPELARGSLLTFIENQRKDGRFRGYIDVNHYRQEMFYHANWGRAVMELHRIHPSEEFLAQAYEGLKNYAQYFDRERDEEVSGLYDIDNHYETGQEFSHRYTAVNPKADEDNWGEVFRLKGVDVTVYIYELKQALAAMAEWLGRNEESELWDLEAQRTKSAVLSKMWDARDGMFYDVNPATGKRTRIKAATCFYPYFTDIVSKTHVAGLKKHLLNVKEFWTPFPVPSISADDETFSAEPVWKGKRMNCPWNGRVWPMTNSHIAEALAATAIRFNDESLRKKSAEFISKFIRMMFFEGDPRRPNCFEHYNPMTGAPSLYRGIDDYQHSWVNDLIIKYVCGIRVNDFSVTVDPFPFGLRWLKIENVLVRETKLSVEVRGSRFEVWIGGKMHANSKLGSPIELQF